MVGLAQGAPGVRQEFFARRRQSHPSWRSLEEGRAELPLEIVNLRGERWLRDVQALRGATNVALLGNGDEVAEMTKLQRDPSEETAPLGAWIKVLD